ncbi:metallopeptidase TldD-related protein [Kallotenue papyrolyticum]|uniref:metallopeptidase TldD-related protein n=1 Tax=Kallotenue papyrolyticum TaxID=1325125 RepID=UPI000472F11C|nr:metallopeptidase TldD-related protein [Kallotenue papyrolyticum]
MSYIDDLQTVFGRVDDIIDYRISLSERRGISLGIRDNDVGSVYSPFAYGHTTGGNFLVQWRDGRLSRGNLDGNSLANIEQVLQVARQAAYDDPDAAQFLGPQTVHEVPLWSADIPPLFQERSSVLFEVVARLQAIAGRYTARTLNGGVGASLGRHWLRTSRGLALETPSTSFGCSAVFDGLIGESLAQRTLPAMEAIDAQLAGAGEYLRALRQSAPALPRAQRLVVLHPRVAYSLWSFFVWGNLNGAAIFHGQSPFRIEDFHAQRQVFADDLTVRVDPWQPLGIASFRYTAEGLPSQPTVYIEHGHLRQPILDLKYARRLGLPPTTPPGGAESVLFETERVTEWSALRATLDQALLVLGVLGLHTQDRSSGNFSLATSQALLVRDGEFVGRARATLAGNFFDLLRDPLLRWVRFANQHSPGLALMLPLAIESDAR